MYFTQKLGDEYVKFQGQGLESRSTAWMS